MKKNIGYLGTFLAALLLGMGLMRVWDGKHSAPVVLTAQSIDISGEPLEDTDWIDLENATEPEGLLPDQVPAAPQLATDSQLSPIHMPEIQTVISRSGNNYEPESKVDLKEGIPLGDAKYNTSPAAEKGELQDEDSPSSIVMLTAPVEPLLIKTAEEYKAFKRRARGSYPAANFSKEQVLVLESTSNLPDKVFEIQQVEEKDGKRVVSYRVSVFGLDKKINTHSAVLVKKSDLPLELKQVL